MQLFYFISCIRTTNSIEDKAMFKYSKVINNNNIYNNDTYENTNNNTNINNNQDKPNIHIGR